MSSPNYNYTFQQELAKLNPEQRAAVETTEGPVLVIAGPGTGKTQILSARIGYILSSTDLQVSPHNILCLTYTEAGAHAMRKRLLKFIGPDAYRIHIHTFHGFCNQVIQQNPDYFGYKDLQPVSELESIELFQKLVDSFPPKHPLKRYYGDVYYECDRLKKLFATMKSENWTTTLIDSKITEYLESLPFREEFIYKRKTGEFNKGDLNLRKLKEQQDKMDKLSAAVHEYENFETSMRKAGRYDYNDMLRWVLDAFKEHENLLFRYKEQYLYFLVDEFQDTNGAQSEVLQLLTEDQDNKPNVFVVGDDDQSIYRFQGANLKNITDFVSKYERELAKIVLNKNYRSQQTILDASTSLIEFNNERLINNIDGLSKNFVAEGKFKQATKPRIIEFPNQIHEESFIIQEIERLQAAEEDLSEIAIIYRNHRLVEKIVKVLEEKKIPLNIKQKVDILKLPFIQNLVRILEYLREESERPHYGEYLLFQLMHCDFFQISPRDIAKISVYCSKSDDNGYKKWREVIASKETMFKLGLESASKISEFEANLTLWISQVSNLTVQVLFEKIVTKGNVLKYVMQSPDKVWMMQALTSFFDFIKDQSEKDSGITLKSILKTISLMEKNAIAMEINKTIVSGNGVNFITAHSSKGLEFKNVYILSATTNVWESKRGNNSDFKWPDTLIPSLDENKMEEERRLFYVAMTRAKEHLNISYATFSHTEKGLEPSRFVAEICQQTDLEIERIEIGQEKLVEMSYYNLKASENFYAEFINAAYVSDVLKNYRMSVTHLSKYLRCPISFYFENIIRVPSARNENMGFGSAVHHALEAFFKVMNASEKKEFSSSDEFLGFFEKGMKKFHSHFTDEEYKRRLEYAKEILPEYYTKYVSGWNKVNLLEYRINNAEIAGVPINGALDKLEFDGKNVNVVDYKTGSPEKAMEKLNPPSEKDPMGGDYWRQMVFYKILMDAERNKNWKMISGEFDFIQKAKSGDFIKHKMIISPEEVNMVRDQIIGVYAKIMNQEFSQGCEDENCGWCNFIKYNYSSEKLELVQNEEYD